MPATSDLASQLKQFLLELINPIYLICYRAFEGLNFYFAG